MKRKAKEAPADAADVPVSFHSLITATRLRCAIRAALMHQALRTASGMPAALQSCSLGGLSVFSFALMQRYQYAHASDQLLPLGVHLQPPAGAALIAGGCESGCSISTTAANFRRVPDRTVLRGNVSTEDLSLGNRGSTRGVGFFSAPKQRRCRSVLPISPAYSTCKSEVTVAQVVSPPATEEEDGSSKEASVGRSASGRLAAGRPRAALPAPGDEAAAQDAGGGGGRKRRNTRRKGG